MHDIKIKKCLYNRKKSKRSLKLVGIYLNLYIKICLYSAATDLYMLLKTNCKYNKTFYSYSIVGTNYNIRDFPPLIMTLQY